MWTFGRDLSKSGRTIEGFCIDFVNCSSVAGVIGFPGIGIYSASKHAVNGLTKAAALEYSAQGIRVNAVNPAVIDTEMVDRLAAGFSMKKDELIQFHPIGRLGRVEEVGE